MFAGRGTWCKTVDRHFHHSDASPKSNRVRFHDAWADQLGGATLIPFILVRYSFADATPAYSLYLGKPTRSSCRSRTLEGNICDLYVRLELPPLCRS